MIDWDIVQDDTIQNILCLILLIMCGIATVPIVADAVDHAIATTDPNHVFIGIWGYGLHCDRQGFTDTDYKSDFTIICRFGGSK
jgi:hypothetical protein